MAIPTGPEADGLQVASVKVREAGLQQTVANVLVHAPEQEQKVVMVQQLDNPTSSGPIDFSCFRSVDPHWETLKADAKSIGIKGVKPDQVRTFKARHGIPQGNPLSAEAQALFREEQDTSRRLQVGCSRDVAQRLLRLGEVATAERLECIARLLSSSSETFLWWGKYGTHEYFYLTPSSCRDYLLSGLGLVGLKPRKILARKLWEELSTVLPSADRDNHDPLYWGIATRLADLEGEIPGDKAQLLKWAHFGLQQRDSPFESMLDRLQGRMTLEQARDLLELPATPLSAIAINQAYKQLAFRHHPDIGDGDLQRFQQITEARERLLLTLNATA